MSLAMRQARYAVGDPGLLGFLGGAIKGAVGGFLTGGPAGAILGTAASVAGSLAGPKSISQAKMTPHQILTTVRSGGLGGGSRLASTAKPLFQPMGVATPSLPGLGSGVSIGGPSGVQIGTFKAPALAPAGAAMPVGSSTGALVGAGAGTPCTSGYHYNKTRYYSTRYGVIEKGSVCVKNRRRNPLNPRALSRAMSRVKSAQKAVRCLQLFAGPAARASAKGGGKRGKGRCRTCR